MLYVCSLDFSVGDVPCRLLTVNPHDLKEPRIESSLQHVHSGCEVHYIKSGVLTVDCIGASYRLSAGQLLLIPPGMYHYLRSITEDVERMDMLIEIGRGGKSKTTQMDSFLQKLLLPAPRMFTDENGREPAQLLEKIRCIVTDPRKSPFLRDQWLKALSTELVLLLAEKIPDDEENPEYEQVLPDSDRYIMDQFFNHNYHGNSNMQDLARQLNLSIRQTDRVLQRTYGKGFREKMNECRLAVALDLLRNTEKTMTQISEILGYGGPTNFSAFVKGQTGKTPAQIRREK